MTWTREYTAETDLPAAAIWQAWADVENWGQWNADIESVALDGPFAVGSTISMTPVGEETVTLRVVAADPERRFVDEAEIGGVKITTEHLIEPAGDAARIVYRTEITGPAAAELGPKIGPAITDDFPETIAALIAHCGG